MLCPGLARGCGGAVLTLACEPFNHLAFVAQLRQHDECNKADYAYRH